MSSNHTPPSDKDLLAKAIPIDQAGLAEPESVSLASESNGLAGDVRNKIQVFGEKNKRHEETWNRTPNTTGQGAIHVKTFVSKLRLDAIERLDQQVNEWLDAHPQYEVKFVTTSTGQLMGKIEEPALFMNVWV